MSTCKIIRLSGEFYSSVISFIENVFHNEQNIPKNLIPLESKDQKWWCITNKNEIVGTVAAWKIENDWHWGRLAVHKKLRGLGMGRKLVTNSLNDLFEMGIEKVEIDARDITVKMILEKGGEIVSEKASFYGHPLTQWSLRKVILISLNKFFLERD